MPFIFLSLCLRPGESGSGKTESFKMIVNFLTHIQERSSDSTTSQRKHSTSSITGGAAAAAVTASISANVTSSCSTTGSHKHRRTSSSCSMGPTTNYMLCKNTTATASTSTCLSVQRRQSPSPGPSARRCDAAVQHCSRADSSERQGRCSNVREKMVDFDFSHHKSSENITTIDSSYTTAASIHYSQVQLGTQSGLTLSPHPTKSCFKHHQSTQVPCNTATPLKSNQSIASSSSYARSASPKYLATGSSGGCRQCGHSKCTRAQSFDRDEPEFGSQKSSGSRSLSAYPSVQLQRGSCSNLVRQTSSESYTRDERASLMGSMQRISLYDAHKLSQTVAQKSPSSSTSSRKYKNPLKRLRECVSYADVFLEAMGNAATLKNNNSSRYVSLWWEFIC